MEWPVDCETEGTFLFAAITNVSQLGIFVRTEEPLEVGRVISLKFSLLESNKPCTGRPVGRGSRAQTLR